MAIAAVGAFLCAQNKTAETTTTFTTSADLSAGNVGIIIIAFDNLSTGGGATTDVTSVTVGGNAATKAAERSNAGAAGAACSLWIGFIKAASTIPSGSNIVISFSGSVTAKAAIGQSFSVASGKTLALDGWMQATPDASWGTNLDGTQIYYVWGYGDKLMDYPSIEHAWIRVDSIEGPTITWSHGDDDSRMAVIPQANTTGGNANTNICCCAEWCVLTNTFAQTYPRLDAAYDLTAWLGTFYEVDAPGGTQTSDSRGIRSAGKATGSDSRSARSKGKATESNSRSLRSSGKEIGADSRSIRSSGKATNSDGRGIRTVGNAISSDSRGVRSTGQAITTDFRSIRTSGKDSASECRGVRSSGKLTTVDGRSLRCAGKDAASDNRGLRSEGTGAGTQTSDSRGIRSAAHAIDSSGRGVRAAAKAVSNSDRSVRSSGKAIALDSRSIRTAGKDSGSSNLGMRTSGYGIGSDSRGIRTIGSLSAQSSRGIRTKGGHPAGDLHIGPPTHFATPP